MAMIATAIISSISVNPRARLRRVPKGDIDEDFIMLSVQWRQIHLPIKFNLTPCCRKLNLTPLFHVFHGECYRGHNGDDRYSDH